MTLKPKPNGLANCRRKFKTWLYFKTTLLGEDLHVPALTCAHFSRDQNLHAIWCQFQINTSCIMSRRCWNNWWANTIQETCKHTKKLAYPLGHPMQASTLSKFVYLPVNGTSGWTLLNFTGALARELRYANKRLCSVSFVLCHVQTFSLHHWIVNVLVAKSYCLLYILGNISLHLHNLFAKSYKEI